MAALSPTATPGSPVTTRIVDSADVADSASIGDDSSVWHLAQVREDAVVGAGCIVGRGAYVGTGVHLGDHCKLQNYALVYEPARLGHGVFVGPAAVLTNDTFPRAVNPDGSRKDASDWDAVGVTVGDGASIGARAVCIAPVEIGPWATVAAGAVVAKDVPAHALVVGVPARQVGWVGHAGRPLEPSGTPGQWRCPQTGTTYLESDGALRRAGTDEETT
ncbi:acyltransferase [Serinicoccus sp. CUA-874]|uniref:acyltransferase n=1 Tax=Serinicoccus sp. CUA-874 TaxID=1517939 RepID=UPI00192D0FB3|nr:acyltransferase [Serinicoccus sp. CUA-874]